MQNTEEMDNKKIGERIKKLRRQAGISQIELAREIEVSQTHMSNIENGNTGISLWTAVKIGRVLQCSLDRLVEEYPVADKNYDNEKYMIDIDELADVLKIIAVKNKERYRSDNGHN